MGRDKALIQFQGQPLWRHQLNTLRQLTPEQLLLAGNLRDAEVETIADEIPNAGPLGGVAAALQNSSAPHLVVLAVDLPLITTSFLQSLVDLCDERRGVVPQRALRFEPLAAVYARGSAGLASAALRAGDFSMQQFVRAALRENLLVARTISDDQVPFFANLNTPADLALL